MHELPVVESILELVTTTATQSGAKRVLAVELEIGELSSFVDDSVQFYFDILSRATVAEGAKLHIRRSPGTAYCWECGHESPVRIPLPASCPLCGSGHVQVQGGDRCALISIEVEMASEGQTDLGTEAYGRNEEGSGHQADPQRQ